MDYKAFLAKTETLVLPYFGGTRVDASDRRLRVDPAAIEGFAPGWWRFQVDGRNAVPTEQAPPADLSALPAVRGHWVSGWLVIDGKQLARIVFPPDDEPPPLSRVTARRWYSGDVLFDTIDFEDDAEVTARRALEERRPLGDVKGVVPSLRAAFGYALGMRVARELDIEVSHRELTPRVTAIAEAGPDVVREMFTALLEQRRREAEEARRRAEEAEATARLATAAKGARVVQRRGTRHDPSRRADDALERAGARMLSARLVARGEQIDVTYEVDGTRIMSLCAVDTLQILDPGVCLSGAHRVLTLDAMPSVVREAIEDGVLNITRRT